MARLNTYDEKKIKKELSLIDIEDILDFIRKYGTRFNSIQMRRDIEMILYRSKRSLKHKAKAKIKLIFK